MDGALMLSVGWGIPIYTFSSVYLSAFPGRVGFYSSFLALSFQTHLEHAVRICVVRSLYPHSPHVNLRRLQGIVWSSALAQVNRNLSIFSSIKATN